MTPTPDPLLPVGWTWLSFPGKPYEQRHFSDEQPNVVESWENAIATGHITRPVPVYAHPSPPAEAGLRDARHKLTEWALCNMDQMGTVTPAGLREIVDVVAAALSPAPGWISVKDRLPPGYLRVLVAHGSGMVCEAMFGSKFTLNDYREHGVTHWMPLPEPPKEGNP